MSTDNECPAVARLAAESLRQTMASEKNAKTPAVLDFNTQSQGLALEGAQRQDNAKPPPRKWNAPSSNKERDSHAGTRSKQRYERWDGPRGRQRSPGRHWEKTWDQSRPHKSHWERSLEPAKLIWKLKREKLMGIQWKLQGKMTNSPWSNQPKESMKEFAKIPS